MIANFDTMSKVFKECNKLYFNGSLPVPQFGTINKLNTLAKFLYNKDKKGKYPIKYQIIKFSDCYDYTKEDFIDIMVHEMIHYYIALNGIKDNKDHGKEFMKIANELNEKYNLNIVETKDASSFKKSDKAPCFTGIFSFLFG